jgi:dienelactone hydrolase
MVYLWYPTSPKRTDVRGAYLPGASQIDASADAHTRMTNDFGANWPLIISGAIYSHTEEGAPPATNSGKGFPVITFSHGAGGTGFGYTSLIEDVVSHGYVVASIEHTGTAPAVLFHDGRVVVYHEDVMPPNLSPAERFAHMASSISDGINEGAADIRFVLDRLTQMNAGNKQAFPLAGALDVNRFAAMGHSAGAEFAARACQLDVRLKACVDLDGGMVPISALPIYPDGATLKQPLLFLEADHPESQTGGTHAEQEAYYKKKEEQLRTCPAGSYDVILKSAGIAHPSFSDTPLLFAGQDGYPKISVVLHNHQLIEEFVRAFLDKNLKHINAPLLDAKTATSSEATVKPYGH